MGKKILFFELNIIGIARYPIQIANEINVKNCENQFYFLYEEDPDGKIKEVNRQIPKNSKLIKVESNSFKSLRGLLFELDPDVLVVMAQRIPDSALVAIANNLGIQTVMLQHGLYIPFMKKNNSIFIHKMYKSLRYIQYSITVAKTINQTLFKVCWAYFNILTKGKKITQYDLPLKKINASKVLVYGDYWKRYHQSEFGYSLEQQIIVGYPDLDQLNAIKQNTQEDAVCYICQTLVEDDRLPRSNMERFIQLLCENIGNRKLYIKLHPRSDITLYNPLKGKNNVIFLNKKFPHCNKYIGHYSSLIAMGMHLTNNIFLWKFDNHNEYPTYLTNNAWSLSNNVNEFRFFLELEADMAKKNCLNDYFYYEKKTNPINKIIKHLNLEDEC
jgi:hypothetical protein